MHCVRVTPERSAVFVLFGICYETYGLLKVILYYIIDLSTICPIIIQHLIDHMLTTSDSSLRFLISVPLTNQTHNQTCTIIAVLKTEKQLETLTKHFSGRKSVSHFLFHRKIKQPPLIPTDTRYPH